MCEPCEWTENLSRQLGMQSDDDLDDAGGIHDTLMMVIWQLDELLRR